MKLTAHFSEHEFNCPCCNRRVIAERLPEALEDLRTLFCQEMKQIVPIHLISAYRCKAHNKAVGGAEKSRHLLGQAADIHSYGKKGTGISPEKMKELAEKIPDFNFGGIGIYDWGIHVDVRGYQARWDRRSK